MSPKRSIVISLLSTLTISSVFNVQALGQATMIWNDSQGLIEASQCTDRSVEEIPFRVTRYFSNISSDKKPNESLRSEAGQIQFQLPNHSLIQLLAQGEDRHQVRVIGASLNKGSSHHTGTAGPNYGTSKASLKSAKQKLFIDSRSALQINDYVFEIIESKPSRAIPGTELFLEGSLWQVTLEDEQYRMTECCVGKACDNYVLFDVFSKDDENPVAQVGVSARQTKLFEKISGYTAEDLEKKLNAEKKEQQKKEKQQQQQRQQQQNTQISSSSSLPQPVSSDVASSIKAIPGVEVVEGRFENIVCMEQRNASLNVRDESKKNVLFKLDNGAAVKVFQDFGTQSKKLGKETIEFIKIQDVETNKVGFVAKEFISQVSSCGSVESDEPAQGNSAQSTSSDPAAKFLEREYLVCTQSGSPLSVYDTNFKKLSQGYFLESGEKATVIDGTLKDMPTPNGYKYVKVSTESKNIRYVAKDFLTTGKCETSMVASGTSVNGYFFPTTTSTGFSYIASRNRPRQHPGLTGFAGYRSNWGLYGANRSGGRSHAANDLYQPRGMSRPGKAYTQKYYGGPFRAITAGRVLRKPIPFYLGTFETAILHEDGVVSRYGEIYPTTVYKSSRVKAGERIGYIKWVGQNSVAPMLHFENYYAKNNSVKTGSLRGSKRINGKNSRRSEHLFDRTKVMRDLEAKSFR